MEPPPVLRNSRCGCMSEAKGLVFSGRLDAAWLSPAGCCGWDVALGFMAARADLADGLRKGVSRGSSSAFPAVLSAAVQPLLSFDSFSTN